MATKAKKSQATKPLFLTKKEAKAAHDSVVSFIEGLEKQYGKRFDHSFGIMMVTNCADAVDADHPKSTYAYANANASTMSQIAVHAIGSVAKSKKVSPMAVGMAVSMQATYEQK